MFKVFNIVIFHFFYVNVFLKDRVPQRIKNTFKHLSVGGVVMKKQISDRERYINTNIK